MNESIKKQVRKLRWSVALVILQNCDLVTHSATFVFQGSVCCEAATDQKKPTDWSIELLRN